MSPQHDYVIDNSTGANVRSDINSALQAIATNNSGSSAPSATFASQFFADTNEGIMKLRNTSNNDYVNLFTLAGGIDVDAASNFNEDVTFSGSSTSIVFDKSDNAFEFSDNARAKFGTGGDLSIFHNATNSFISNTEGILQIDSDSLVQVNATELRVKNAGDTETIAKFVQNGAIDLNFDNEIKASTITDGFAVTNKLLIYNSSGNNSNMKMSFRATISASSSQTFQVGSNIFAMGTVTIFGSRGVSASNATIATGQIFPIHVSGNATIGMNSAIGSLSGSGGSFSYTVAAASKGVTITNTNSTFALNVMLHFDLTGFVG